MRSLLVNSVAAGVAAVALSFGVAQSAQAQNSTARAAYKVPRTDDGLPDLQGIWTNATVVPLERPVVGG